MQINNVRGFLNDVFKATADFLKWENYEQLYANKFEADKLDNIIEKYDLPKLTQEEREKPI